MFTLRQWESSESRMLLYVYMHFLAIFCFSSKNVFLSFSFPFLMKYQVSATEYYSIRNWNWQK